MGCCHSNKTPIITNTIPHPSPMMSPMSQMMPISSITPMGLNMQQNQVRFEQKSPRNAERPSLRRQMKLQNLQNTVSNNDDGTITQNVTVINGQTARSQSQSYLSQVLKSHFFFHNISQMDRREIIKQMFLCQAKPNTFIFKQNDMASAFFIIHEGSVQVQIGGQPKKTLSRGSYFGQLALLYASPRSASIRVLEPTKCWCITRGVFKKTMQQIMQKNYGMAKSYINKMSIFGFLTQSQKDSIAYSMFVLKYSNGQVIFKQKDDANSFYIVTQGKVQLTTKNKPKLSFNPGDSFGEESFRQNSLRAGSAISAGNTICLSVGRDVIKNILGGQISSIIYYNISKWAIKRSQFLSKLSNIQIQKLLSSCEYIQYKSGQRVFEVNQQPSKIAIVLEGKVNGMPAGTLIGQQFFKTYLLQPVSKQYIKQDAGVIGQIPFSVISQLTGKSLEQIINKPITSCHDKRMEQIIPSGDYSHIKMQNLMYMKKLGEGQFGKVYLVKDKLTNQNYAIKCIAKSQIVSNKMEKIMIQEKHILELIDFNFLLKFYRTFKDDRFIYLVTEYIRGSELFDVIREIGLLSKSIARFYISSIILSIQYLHLKAVIYRDLKPQNIMVQSNGYLKLIDMGTAKQLKQNNGFRTFTIIGTPHYMAPQVMLGKGYSFSTDIWTVGVILFEFLCGQLPFGEDLDDPFAVHSAIMSSQLKYPPFMTDLKAKKVIDQLLSKPSDSRLPKGFAALKAMSYFDGFDWQQLYQRNMKAPYVSKKSQVPERPLPDGVPFQSMISKQKAKTKAPGPSKIPNWDQIF